MTTTKLDVWLRRRMKHAELRERDAKSHGDRMYWGSRANALDDVLLKLTELQNEEEEENG